MQCLFSEQHYSKFTEMQENIKHHVVKKNEINATKTNVMRDPSTHVILRRMSISYFKKITNKRHAETTLKPDFSMF